MYRRTFTAAGKLAVLATVSSLAATSAHAMPFGGGAAVTDRFGYSGTILRYETIADALDGTNSIDSI
jgi:hypothetical protein